MTVTTHTATVPAATATRARRAWTANALSKYGTIIGLIVLVVFFSVESEHFFSLDNLRNILTSSAILGVLAAGLTVVLVLGDFDLSIGYTATAGGMLAAGTAQTFGTFGGMLAAIGLGLVVGIINGILVTRFGVSAFIATLAMGQVIAGWLLWYNDGTQIFELLPEDFATIGTGSAGPVPYLLIAWGVVALGLWLYLERTAAGRKIYAIGANPVAARMSGIAVNRNRVIAFVLCGGLAGVAGWLLASNISAGQPQAGLGYLLPAFAACFIGAATLRPGQFHTIGTVVGVLVLGVLQNGLVLVGASPAWATAAQGIVLVIAVAISGTFTRLVKK